MERFTPSQVEDLIQTIQIDPENEDLPPFTCYVDGREVGSHYTLYDENFKEIPFISYSYENVKDGKYIAELQAAFEDSESSFDMQYFFGVIVH